MESGPHKGPARRTPASVPAAQWTECLRRRTAFVYCATIPLRNYEVVRFACMPPMPIMLFRPLGVADEASPSTATLEFDWDHSRGFN